MTGKYYIGIDNGVTGSVGITSSCPEFTPIFFYIPSFKKQDYTKKKKRVSRIDSKKLNDLISRYKCYVGHDEKNNNVIAVLERPMLNPTRWTASISASRALETTLIVLEDLNIPYQFIDSKEWQKEMLPKGIKGSKELKQASREIGERLFPQFKPYKKIQDADGILIAEWAKRKNL
jgi:hypothetical protein